MKWKEMTVFHRVVFISMCASSLAILTMFLCYFGGVFDLYEHPLYITLLGIVWLGQAILNWKKQRALAIFHLVMALVSFVAPCCWLAFKLIV